jgi:hypothetical protein
MTPADTPDNNPLANASSDALDLNADVASPAELAWREAIDGGDAARGIIVIDQRKLSPGAFIDAGILMPDEFDALAEEHAQPAPKPFTPFRLNPRSRSTAVDRSKRTPAPEGGSE